MVGAAKLRNVQADELQPGLWRRRGQLQHGFQWGRDQRRVPVAPRCLVVQFHLACGAEVVASSDSAGRAMQRHS